MRSATEDKAGGGVGAVLVGRAGFVCVWPYPGADPKQQGGCLAGSGLRARCRLDLVYDTSWVPWAARIILIARGLRRPLTPGRRCGSVEPDWIAWRTKEKPRWT